MNEGWRRFADLLACPRCRGTLELERVAPRCRDCGAEYAFEAGIPVFCDPPPSAAGSIAPFGDRRHLHRVRAFMESFASDARLLDVGCGDSTWGPRALHVDAAPTTAADMLADAHALPLADAGFDGVLADGVLEHVRDPRRVAAEIVRVLKPGGRVFASVPFLQPIHGGGDYTRATLDGLRDWFGGVEETEAGIAWGPASAIAWILSEALPLGWAFSWIRVFDPIFRRRAERVAGGFYFIGRKRS